MEHFDIYILFSVHKGTFSDPFFVTKERRNRR